MSSKPSGKPKHRDFRTDGWRKNWKKRQLAEGKAKAKAGPDPKIAAAAVKGLRRASKKSKTFEIRKAMRKLAEEREKAAAHGQEGAGAGARIIKLEALVEKLKVIDLDSFTSAAAAAIPEMSNEMHAKLFPKHHPAPPLPEGGEALLRAEAVKQGLRAIASPLDPNLAQAVKQDRSKAPRDDGSDAEDALGDSDVMQGESDDDEGAARRRMGLDSDDEDFGMGGSDDESEPEDVSALIGDKPQKNRPGQRTRRKMILKQYGKDAKIFQKKALNKAGGTGMRGGLHKGAGAQVSSTPRKTTGPSSTPRKTTGPRPPLAGQFKPPGRGGFNKGGGGYSRGGGHARGGGNSREGGGAGGRENGGAARPSKDKFGASGGGGGSGPGAMGNSNKKQRVEKLHPSWEAKKQASIKQAAGLAQPKVHIKFDDD